MSCDVFFEFRKETNQMNSEYTMPELVEIGNAEDVVRGDKEWGTPVDEFSLRMDNDLDDWTPEAAIGAGM
jgi:hypothetical protein